MTSRSRLAIIAIILIAVVASGACQTAKISAISIVKNGVLKDYNTTTVGKAFEGTFQHVKWTSLETPKGEIIVQFDGSVALKNCPTCSIGRDKLRDKLWNDCIGSEELTEKFAAITKISEDHLRTFTAANEPFQERRRQLPCTDATLCDEYMPVILSEQQRINNEMQTGQIARGRLTRDYQERRQQENLQATQERLKAQVDQQERRRLGISNHPKLDQWNKEYNEFTASYEHQKAEDQQQKNQLDAIVENCVVPKQDNFEVPVKFQFTLSADKKTFEISYVDDAFNNRLDRALSFIYQ